MLFSLLGKVSLIAFSSWGLTQAYSHVFKQEKWENQIDWFSFRTDINVMWMGSWKGKLFPCLRFKSGSHTLQNKGSPTYPALVILFLVMLTSEWLKIQYFGQWSERKSLGCKYYLWIYFFCFPPASPPAERSSSLWKQAHLCFAQTFGFEQLKYLWQKSILPEKFPPTPMLIFWKIVTGLQFYQEFHQQI